MAEVFHTTLVHFNFKEVKVDVEAALHLPNLSEHSAKWNGEGGYNRSVGKYVDHWLTLISKFWMQASFIVMLPILQILELTDIYRALPHVNVDVLVQLKW